ncbi:hypothetical protein KZ810_08075 [Sphingomonas sp. RHCKR47]|uniref:hypothetical protein n=1 Tax=Sphingomonas citricola TaxID=2862498 RepID=UPI001CA4712B|nr:hypothetical protein [Sphingomonas citricola]MBW6523454.1 hypothetical protein [Sphingomonas citricola]
MWGLFSKRSREQAPPQPVSLADEIEAACARQAEARRARAPRDEAKRFAHARPKLEQLRHDIAMQQVDF